jgi:hypothetical protein
MGLDVRYPHVFSAFLSLLSDVYQDVEAGEFRIALDYGLSLLSEQRIELLDCPQELIEQPPFFLAISDCDGVLRLVQPRGHTRVRSSSGVKICKVLPTVRKFTDP